ncbi:general substrate transporter [Daldinia loculata]|uniref:general substrate transporter n=1 Tax=Daldinia loculata TaxID=103429 RepID=UPI0020C23980|nr:general substrate transporter [Daldinia loculata]KAI1646073.1 general substrate transporter [Daldinia loculata]
MVAAAISANPLQLDIRSHKKCLAICFVVTISSFQYGLDYALVGGFMAMPGFLKVFGYYDEAAHKWAIDPTVQQLISSLMTIGTFVGSLSVGPFSSRFGRRQGLWAASLLNCIATAIMIGTTNLGALYFARFVLGISVGWFLTFAQVYINEAAPAHLRGIAFAVYQSQLSIGSIVGSAIDYGTHTMLGKEAYRIPLAIFFVAPTIQTIALFFFPESPRWLMTQGREAEAESALRRLRNSNIKENEFQAEFEEIRTSTAAQADQFKGKHLWVEMWKGTNRRRSILSVAVICFHCANGSSWLNIYTTYFLTVAGVKEAFSYSTMITCMGLIGVLASFFVVRHIDRRVILLIGVAACGFCQLAFAIAWTVAPGTVATAKVVIAFIALFTFFYVAYAPYAWLLGGELPSNHLRAHTYGVATALNFLGNWLGVFTAPYFINPASLGWSAKYGYIWFGSNMIVFLFTWAFMPETRDRTLEEINEIFEAKVPARKFKRYICTEREAVRVAVIEEKNRSASHVEEVTQEGA